ncbi:MAG: hypothetical protein IJ079_04960 [Lachnospiraceae bacterium]|nr:hypothetical protein [Lachnospiraceae bacterium]
MDDLGMDELDTVESELAMEDGDLAESQMDQNMEQLEDFSEISEVNEMGEANSDAWMEGLSIEERTEARDALEDYQQQVQSDVAFDNYLDTLSVNELYDLRDALDDESDGDAKVLRMG